MPDVSIITVVYNGAELLPPTIESVRKQTGVTIEHLFIDGASTDASLAVIRRYEAEAVSPLTVRVVSEPDRGLYDAMNKALRLATGRYLLFINAGDRLHEPDTLATMLRCADAAGGDAAVVYGDTHVIDADGRFVSRRHLLPPDRLSWRSFRMGMLVCHQAFMVATQLAAETPYDLQYRYSADFDWCVRIMKKAEACGMPLVNARIVVADFLEGGLTTKRHRASLRERYRIMAHYYGSFSTVMMHLWFACRTTVRKIKRLAAR